ncbi:hypothetical protein HK096_005973, partial [Nowakowskiella sp. JEL0078]
MNSVLIVLIWTILLVGTVSSASLQIPLKSHSKTVYLCSDSTIEVKNSANKVLSNWGDHLSSFISLKVKNMGIPRSSVRSIFRDGTFNKIANLVQPGDIVVLQFGNSGGGGLMSPDNGLGTVTGTGDNAVESYFKNSREIVHTHFWYLKNVALLMKEKGAIVIIATPTPLGSWDISGRRISRCSRFCIESRQVAIETSSLFVDHYYYTSMAYMFLGKNIVDKFFPLDQIHTSPEGAEIVAKAFVAGCICSCNVIKKWLIKSPPHLEIL